MLVAATIAVEVGTFLGRNHFFVFLCISQTLHD